MLMRTTLLFRAGRSKAYGREIGKQCGGCRSRPLRILHVGRMGYFRSTCSTVSMLHFINNNFPNIYFLTRLFHDISTFIAYKIKIISTCFELIESLNTNLKSVTKMFTSFTRTFP